MISSKSIFSIQYWAFFNWGKMILKTYPRIFLILFPSIHYCLGWTATERRLLDSPFLTCIEFSNSFFFCHGHPKIHVSSRKHNFVKIIGIKFQTPTLWVVFWISKNLWTFKLVFWWAPFFSFCCVPYFFPSSASYCIEHDYWWYFIIFTCNTCGNLKTNFRSRFCWKWLKELLPFFDWINKINFTFKRDGINSSNCCLVN